MWIGKGANSREAIAAEESVDVVVQGLSSPKVLKIYEDKETADFWYVSRNRLLYLMSNELMVFNHGTRLEL